MAGVRPEEARAIGWEEDVDLDGNPPSVAVLRADRAGGDTSRCIPHSPLPSVASDFGNRAEADAWREAAGTVMNS